MKNKSKDRCEINKIDFFYGATLKICSSLKIEQVLRESLLYICKYIPVTQMGLHLFNQNLGIGETIAMATADGCKTASFKTTHLKQLNKKTKHQYLPLIRSISRMGDEASTIKMAKYFKCEDMSALGMDLVIDEKYLGAVTIHGKPFEKYSKDDETLLSLLNKPLSLALLNSIRYRECQDLKNLLADDNRYLQDELIRISGEEIIGADFGLNEVMNKVRKVAPLNSPVLLLGETGTGKEIIANTIQNFSKCREGPFIKVNCGAVSESLMDSELFGHEKGSFTGALSQKRGRFERAHNGTIFLDEIGELSKEAQVRLLRVLQEKEIERLGGTETIKVEIRVIAATHRNLSEMVSQGQFREDLYYRLKVFPIEIPPLRDRNGDIPSLVHHFLQKKRMEMKLGNTPVLVPDAIDRLMAYHWPGNVRELENIVEHEIILSDGRPLTFGNIDGKNIDYKLQTSSPMNCSLLSLDKAMIQHIQRALNISHGKIEGKGGAAELLEINPKTLRHRMKNLGVPFGNKAKTLYRLD